MKPDDPLLQRYQEANALDTARPDAALREKVLAHARAAAETHRTPGADKPRAANDGAWRWRALGGLAVLGLATLVVLQFDRGTPDERDIALSPKPATSQTAPTPTPRAEMREAPPPSPPPLTAPVKPGAPQASNAESARNAPAIAQPPSRRAAPAPTQEQAPPRNTPAPAPAEASPQPSRPAPAPAPPPPPAEAETPPPPALSRNTPAAQDHESHAAGSSADAAAMPRARGLAREETAAGLSSSRRAAAPAMAPSPNTALLAAASRGTQAAVRDALAQGADVNATDAHRRTALMLAAQRGDAALVRLLLDAGADPQRTDAAGLRAQDFAQQAGHDALLPLLENRAPR